MEALQNPSSNKIGAGVTQSQILNAVDKSGYPLQTVVAEILRPQFAVQEEWRFVDRDSKELRSIDLLADLRMHDYDPQPRVRPHLNLLIECKQSQLPYVFFLSEAKTFLLNFPMVAGLHDDQIVITTDDDPSRWIFTIVHALDLPSEQFHLRPPSCHTFSKCVRKGSGIELSGTEVFANLILPLVKSLQHFHNAEKPVETALYFDAHLTFAVGVLDAPMIAASTKSGKSALTFIPWVRVFRHEYLEKANRTERDQKWAIDNVHRDFFREYLDRHLIPFAKTFAERALRHPTEIATGQAFASGMGANSFGLMEKRLKPRPLVKKIGRASVIVSNILRSLFRLPKRRSKH